MRHTDGICIKNVCTAGMEMGKLGDIKDFGIYDNPLLILY